MWSRLFGNGRSRGADHNLGAWGGAGATNLMMVLDVIEVVEEKSTSAHVGGRGGSTGPFGIMDCILAVSKSVFNCKHLTCETCGST